MAALRETVDSLSSAVEQLQDENNRLFALLAADNDTPRRPGPGTASEPETAAGDGGPAPDSVALASWGERASAQDWDELIDWVDWFLATYQVQQCHLFACWPAHPGIVEDLAALKMAWEEAAAKATDAGWAATEAMAYWHDRYLPGFFARLHPVHSAAMCKHKHETGARPTRTDRDCVVVYATGQPLTDALAQDGAGRDEPVGAAR